MATRILCVDPDESDREEAVESLRSELTDLDPVVETVGTLADAEEALMPSPTNATVRPPA